MRSFLLFIVLAYATLTWSQNLTYRPIRNYTFIEATDETFFIKGKKQLQSGYFYPVDWKKMLDGIPEKYVTTQQYELMKKNPLTAYFFIDKEGKVVKVQFLANEEIYQKFPKEVFVKLYNACRAVKIDLNKLQDFNGQTFGKDNFIRIVWRLK